MTSILPPAQTEVQAYVGLGANLGDAKVTLLLALRELEALPCTRVLARSSIYRSAPVDAAGPDFINAVAHLATGLAPAALLAALQAIEARHGRTRPYPNAPRTLDLDLLLYGDRQLHSEDLTLPHPRLHQRAFVLRPLLELDPGLAPPGLGPLAAFLDRVSGQPVEAINA